MRLAISATVALLAGCSSAAPDAARMTLNDPYWDRVNVELVITKRADCDSRGEGYIDTRQIVMRKNKTETIDVPNGANLCWRHDRDPNNPRDGVWSGWTRAVLFPGKEAQADI